MTSEGQVSRGGMGGVLHAGTPLVGGVSGEGGTGGVHDPRAETARQIAASAFGALQEGMTYGVTRLLGLLHCGPGGTLRFEPAADRDTVATR